MATLSYLQCQYSDHTNQLKSFVVASYHVLGNQGMFKIKIRLKVQTGCAAHTVLGT
jgi:hypothetical protein